MKRRFIHIFNGDSYFNCIGILKGIARLEEYGDFSVGKKLIFVSERSTIERYSEFDCEKSRIMFCVAGGGRYFDLLVKTLKILQYCSYHIVFHGHQKLAAYFSKIPFMAVSWYCWGLGSKVTKSFYTDLRRCKNIFCTMDPDTKVLRGLGLSQTRTLVYGSSGALPIPEGFVANPIPQSGLHILLGNSCWSIDGYFKLLDDLKRFGHLIDCVTCVVSYGKPEVHQEKIASLSRLGIQLFGGRFSLLKELMPLDRFYKFINKYDIYMSLNEQQGGLGVIHAMLAFGKMVYLSGVNYEWVKRRGYEIFNCRELKKVEHLLGRGFTPELQQKNFEQYRRLVDPSMEARMWRDVFVE